MEIVCLRHAKKHFVAGWKMFSTRERPSPRRTFASPHQKHPGLSCAEIETESEDFSFGERLEEPRLNFMAAGVSWPKTQGCSPATIYRVTLKVALPLPEL
jgi:hypothetical protein